MPIFQFELLVLQKSSGSTFGLTKEIKLQHKLNVINRTKYHTKFKLEFGTTEATKDIIKPIERYETTCDFNLKVAST